MTEPTFIAEAKASDHKSGVELKQWVNRQLEQARAKGCQHIRATNDPASIGHVLLEAWLTKPADEGQPRWGKAQ